MGTNYYARMLPKKEDKDLLKEAIDKNYFDKVIKLTNQMYGMKQSPGEKCGVIHLGKRSGGWKFLWNTNWLKKYVGNKNEYEVEKFYDLNKKSIFNFLSQPNIIIVDEYFDETQPISNDVDSNHIWSAKEFMDMAVNWGAPKKDENGKIIEGWDAKSYHKEYPEYPEWWHSYEKYDMFVKNGYEIKSQYDSEFYSDGLRFSLSTEFS